MPAGKFGAYFEKATGFGKKMVGGARGKMTAQNVTKMGQSIQSSARLNKVKNTKMAQSVARHPYRAGTAGVAGLGAASYMTGGSRRGRGTDKMRSGRPTGMYKY